jgi:hypothetical protein
MRSYNDTVKDDLQNDAEFRHALLSEIVACMAAGEVATGKSVLRKYIDGTIGFQALGNAVGRTPASLLAMLGAESSPSVGDFFEIVAYLQRSKASF